MFSTQCNSTLPVFIFAFAFAFVFAFLFVFVLAFVIAFVFEFEFSFLFSFVFYLYLCLCCSKEEDQEVVPPTSTRKPDGASSSTAGCSVRVLQCLYALFKISFTICALSSMFDGRLYYLRFV